ncbi:SAM-dependent methyltransferase [Pleurocapsa sp. CCALA 161]|uniref:class I SAM-dependent methyltransferase n=1 Tax=Pleurocapsa sp. CCALA 161 TaxID=2107688 RepID=UPI000D05AFDB|nr:class I SAM-dependent methyltransferase [Pleurocapsa sp. CCALA 161]PSB07171.1 SAM-dependent methyltransferase [Pleurocapsa sp. CCALA 161]
MTVTSQPKMNLTSRLVQGILSIKPLADFAKSRARQMMIRRAEVMGVPWRENVQQLSDRRWTEEFAQIHNPDLQYPDYYTTSFHAYPEGNLSWKAAWEVESAARSVHAKIWAEVGINGDTMLRQSYHQALQEYVTTTPNTILDLGCGVGMSSIALQEVYPLAELTGIDLSPYFLAVAQYRAKQQQHPIKWIHGAAESTGSATQSFDLVSGCLVFHELPTSAAQAIITEAHRVLRPGGYLSIMDMNPQSPVFQKMPPYILTLLKSTEPYLDQYFSLDMEQTFIAAGFTTPRISITTPRHRIIIAQAQ